MRKQILTKRLLSLLLSVTLILSLFSGVTLDLPMKASAVTVGNFSYEVLDDGTCSVTGYSGRDTDLIIPSHIDGYTVTAIADGAFRDRTKLTSVVIPEGVTYIGEWAFAACSNLTSITIPASVTCIRKQAFILCTSLEGFWVPESNSAYCNDSCGVLFDKEKTVLLQAPGTLSGDYVIPEGVTQIAYAAFWKCTGLTGVSIPDSVTDIEECAFVRCVGLTSVSIPEGVTSLNGNVFEACEGLTSVTLPKGLTDISYYAFSGCTSLTDVTIPEGVTSINKRAFEECTSLKTITFQGMAPELTGAVFADTTVTAYYPANDPTWTEDVMQDYGGTITWVPYEETESLEGVTVSGSLTSFQGENLVMELWLEGAQEASYSAVISDGSYCFEKVPEGNYILKISMDHGVTREYQVTTGSDEIALDVKISPIGDMSGDGKVNVADTSKAYAYARGAAEITDEYALLCGDVTGDGKINVADVSRIYAHTRGVSTLW